jgi:hypothetical protein
VAFALTSLFESSSHIPCPLPPQVVLRIETLSGCVHDLDTRKKHGETVTSRLEADNLPTCV